MPGRGKTSKKHKKRNRRRRKQLLEDFKAICSAQRVEAAIQLHEQLEKANLTLSQEELSEGFYHFVLQPPKRGIEDVIQSAEDIFFNKFGLSLDRVSTEIYWRLFEQFNSTITLVPWIRFFMSHGFEMSPGDISLYHLFDELCWAYRWQTIRKEVFQLGLELCVVEFGLYIDLPSPEVDSIEERRRILSKSCNRNSAFITAGLANRSDGFAVDPGEEDEDPGQKQFQAQLYNSYHSYRSLYFRTCTGKIHFQAIVDAVRCYFVFEEDAFDVITPIITEFLFGAAHGFLTVTRTFPSKSPSYSSMNPVETSPILIAAAVSRETSTLSDVGNFIAT